MHDPRSRDASSRSQTAHRWLLAVLWLAAASLGSTASAEGRLTPIVRAVRDVSPAVVNIQGQKSVDEAGEASPGGSRQVNGMGTGVVIDPRGYILTNHHVVDGVRQIKVTLSGGQTYLAQLVAHDQETDLAVIRIRTPRSLRLIRLGTSDDLMCGEPVIAMGNAFGYEHTVTKGIISALHRNVQVNETQRYLDLIQTDASINPGNSGGPLLNIDGEMIGVNVAVRAGAQGIGFAIPIDKALEIATELLSIEALDNHWHGMSPMLLDGSKGPVTIARVARNSPAQLCGLERGDQLERVGTLSISRPIDVERALLGRRAGDNVPVMVRRGEETLELELAVASCSSRATFPDGSSPLQQATWESLGLILKKASRESFSSSDLPYQGGMRVVAVRPGSSAAKQGVRKEDILVRMHRWTTVSDQDLRLIVGRVDSLARAGTVKFYIVRGEDTFFGHLTVASLSKTARR